MIHDVNNISLTEPFSFIVSIILFFGLIFVGDVFQKLFIKNFNNYNFINYNICFSPIIGTYILTFLLYILLILEFYASFFIQTFSYLLLILGFIKLYLNKDLYLVLIKKYRFKQSLETNLIIAFYLLLFFISASPITHADTLDYHFYGALNLIIDGHFQKDILPMHSILVSVGEIPLAVGLSIGAEQFGGIIQFSSLLSLIPVFFNNSRNKIFLLAILSCPITFFLVSSPKPQLLFSISSLLIFIFLIKYFSKIKKDEISTFLFIGTIILLINILGKFSFGLSSILLFIYCYFIFLKKKKIYTPIIIGLTAFGIIILPNWIFRHVNFDTSIVHLLISPLPLNIYGYESFHNLLSAGSINLVNIIGLTNLQEFSTTFGPLFLILFLMINKKILQFKFPLTIIIVFIISVFLFGSSLTRFLYEGYLWLIFLISLICIEKSKIYKFFSKIVLGQSTLVLLICFYFVIKIFPGSINKNYKKKIMIDNANGFELAEWVNTKLNNEDVIISTHRSISLFKMKTFSNLFLLNVDLDNKLFTKYTNYLKLKKINRIVFYGEKLETKPFEKCLGKQLYYKKNVGRHVGRNPFTETEYYNGWIYEFKFDNLPNCLIK